MSMKNPMTPAGIEPATFRFVTQHLNHCATAVPNPSQKANIFSQIQKFPAFYGTQRFNACSHTSLPLVPILSQTCTSSS